MTNLSFKKINIEAYEPGKSTIKKLKKVIKLSANESALGMSSRVKKIVSNKRFNFNVIRNVTKTNTLWSMKLMSRSSHKIYI